MAAAITNNGLSFILFNLNHSFPLGQFYFGWGTGEGTSNPVDTALFSEQSGGSPIYQRSWVNTTLVSSASSDTLTFSGSMQANAALTITNAGIFNNGGELVYHRDFDPIVTAIGNDYPFEYTFHIT